MSSECDAAVPYVPPAEGLGKIVRTAVVQAVASEDPAGTQDCTPDYSEFHHGPVEVFRTCGAVDAGFPEIRGEHFLVGSDRQEIDFPCYVLSHVLKIPVGSVLFNAKPVKGFD